MSVSCTSNLLAQMFDFPKCIRVLLMFIMSLQSLLQNENLENKPNRHCCAVFPHNKIAQIHMYDECKRSNDSVVCHRLCLVHFVIDRASLFTDRRISGLPIWAKYKHFRTI